MPPSRSASRVTDHGPGLPEEVLPHVFGRLYKADAARTRSEGSELGLSIAMKNATLRGGTIEAGNQPGGGSKFTLRLCAGEVGNPRSARPTARVRLPSSAIPASPPRFVGSWC
ncbi:ATP-binding protein [Saccharopolyspora sp. NPDC000995]